MKHLLWLGLLVCGASQATEVVWLKLTPHFSYRDITTICSTTIATKEVYFGAELEGNLALRAVLKDNLSGILADSIPFSPSELSGIVIHRDGAQQAWLRSFSASGRLLNWLFFHSGDSFECRPSQPLATLSPAPFDYLFDTDGLGDTLFFTDSNLGKFSGKRADGASYQAQLHFGQERLSSGR